jgi:branched-chain amino acid transport system substrate-binding protein
MKSKNYCTPLSIIMSFLSLLLLFSLSACEKPQVKEKSLIRIGALLPLTGPLSNRGQQEKEAIELAINDFNSTSSDVTMKVIFEDSYGRSPEDIAVKLLDYHKVSAIIASTTPVSRSISHLANKNKLIMAFLCSDPLIQTESPYIFRLYESKEAEAEQIVKYLTITDKKVAVLYLDQQEISNQLANYLMPQFRRNNIRVLFYEPYRPGEINFKKTTDRMKFSETESILILGFGDELRLIFKELTRQKLIGKINIVGGIGLLSLNDTATTLPDGVILAIPQYVIEKNEKARAFDENFQKTYNHTPNLNAAFAYNAVQILSEGLAYGLVKGHGNAETVSFHVTNRTYQGIMGKVHVDNQGALMVPMDLCVIREGKISPFKVDLNK